jgi:hypothetical protein
LKEVIQAFAGELWVAVMNDHYSDAGFSHGGNSRGDGLCVLP